MNKIDYCFIYFNGRKHRLVELESIPKEFFYGLKYPISRGYEVEIIEYGEKHLKNYKFNNILILLEKYFTRLLKFQFNFSQIIKPYNWNVLKRSKNLILTNNRIAFTILPFLIYSKYKKLDINSVVIAMGLFNSSTKNKFLLKIHNVLHKIMLSYIDRIIFLGEPEFKFALDKFDKHKEKLEYIPFGIDTEFWQKQNENYDIKDFILFVGNDSNRDFEFLSKLAVEIPDKQFVIVSEKLSSEEIQLDNVRVISGSWNRMTLSDSFLRLLYSNAKVTIIPLKETIQPSGQSVTLQSLSIGTPVIITKTRGFWDEKNFINCENILFTHSNSLSEWKDALETVFSNQELTDKLSKNSIKLINNKFNLENFNKKLFEREI